MDNEKQNNSSRPFSTFDWSNLSENEVSKPKDVTSDMWVPISSGLTSEKSPESSRLRDAQRPRPSSAQPQKRPAAKSAQKSAERKSRAKKRPAPTPERKAAKRPTSQRPTSPERRRPEPKGQNAKKSPAKRESDLKREQKRREQARRSFEKSNKNFEKQHAAGNSRDDITRKRAKKKRRSKSFYAVLITLITLFVATGGALIYCFAVGSPITEIVVDGESVYSSEKIIQSCGVAVGENLFSVREKKVNSTLCSSLPYIGSVKVKYSLPDKLCLTVTDTSEKYLISSSNSFICLDENEKVLSVKKKKLKAGEYRLEGFKGGSAQPGSLYEPCEEDVPRFEKAKEIVAALEKAGLEKANVLKLSSLDNIVVVYDSRFNIFLGSADNVEARLSLAARTLKTSLTKNNKGYVDVRFDGKAFFNEGSMEP